jgi:hypothetical protein
MGHFSGLLQSLTGTCVNMQRFCGALHSMQMEQIGEYLSILVPALHHYFVAFSIAASSHVLCGARCLVESEWCADGG